MSNLDTKMEQSTLNLLIFESVKTFIMSQPPAKRRRTQFSVADKKEIIAYKTDHPTATQYEIAARFARKWGMKVGRLTVRDILGCY